LEYNDLAPLPWERGWGEADRSLGEDGERQKEIREEDGGRVKK
jgi:hypothetical protein